MKMQILKAGLTVIAILLFPLYMQAQEDGVKIYTEERPLVYEDAWDLCPFSFLDENNEPTGFNVELVRMLMKELGIPYIIRLKGRKAVLADLKTGQADLTMGMDALFHDEYGYYGRSVIQLFTHSVVSPKDQPATIRSLQDLKTHTVIVHRNSYSHHLMMDKGWGDNAIGYDDMKEAIARVSEENNGQVVWNTASLKWLLANLHIDNLQINAINMPHGEYKFISKDSLLLSKLDETYVRLRSADKLEAMQGKWFHPEYRETGIPSWIWFLTAAIALTAFVLIFYNVSYRIRERHMQELVLQTHNRLSVILQATHVRIWTYDVDSQRFTMMDNNGRPQRQYSGLEFAHLYHPEDFHRIGEAIRLLIAGEKEQVTLELKAFDNENDSEQEREFVTMLSVLRSNDGKPSVIIGTRHDVTQERERQRKTKERMLRYQSVFDTAMVDMVYFDGDGNVADMNERAKQSFHSSIEQAVEHKVNIIDCLEEPSYRLQDYFYATQIVGNKYGIAYYERQLVPVYSSQNKLLGIYGTGRAVTEVAETYRKLQEGISELQKSNKKVTDYISNIDYVLGVGGVRMASYSPRTHTLTISKSQNVVQMALTQTRCMTIIDDKWKRAAMRVMNNMDNLTTETIDMQVKTVLRRKGLPFYLHLRLIPIYNDEGTVESYFGLCRDVSEIKNTELQLEKESQRAQEVENLKNVFLRNMSYEIRTPLNNVVGFAELFEQEHEQADEDIFINEIKNSSAHLLQLINDILFLSRLDAHMIEINKQPIDFAKTFEGHCQIGWANFMAEGVNYVVENPYEQLVVDIDDTNLGRVIEQIACNAAQHTTSGMVRARYDYIGGKLMIAIDDTGCGMTKDTLSQIYERFSSANHQGTGLGLPICKQLVEQMGGSIDISSELGKGTTVWIMMPCEATIMDRRKQI